MMCTAPSKTFNLAGMATSNLFIPDSEMRRKFRSELLDVGQENMNRLGLFACRAAYEGGGNGWISLSAIWLAIWHWCAISVKPCAADSTGRTGGNVSGMAGLP